MMQLMPESLQAKALNQSKIRKSIVKPRPKSPSMAKIELFEDIEA